MPPPLQRPMTPLQQATRAPACPPKWCSRGNSIAGRRRPLRCRCFICRSGRPGRPPHRRSGENSTAGRRRCCGFCRRCRARGRCGRFRHTLRRHIGEDTGAGHRFSRRCCCSKYHCRRCRLLWSLQQRHFSTETTPEQPRHHRQKTFQIWGFFRPPRHLRS